ncbi:unnamed protein product [Sphagnum balticum]
MSFAFNRYAILQKAQSTLEADSPGFKDWIVETEGDSRTGVVTKRDFSTDKRKKLADTGAAMPDGSFPIENEEDLHNAVRLVGHAKNPKAAKAHIKARAKALGASLPDSWVSKADEKETKDQKDKPLKKAGIEVQTADPESGVYAHTLGGKTIGHTVKAVHDGTIAWTAVPAGGTIKGKFKSHEDAKQYLADNCANNMAQEEMANKLGAQKGGNKVKKEEITTIELVAEELIQIAKDWKEFDESRSQGGKGRPGKGWDKTNVNHKQRLASLNAQRRAAAKDPNFKKDDEEIGDEDTEVAEKADDAPEDNMKGDSVSATTSEVAKFVSKLDTLEDDLITVRKDWATWDEARQAGSTRAAARTASSVAFGEHTVSGHQKAIQYHEADKAAQLKSDPSSNVRFNDRMIGMHNDAISQLRGGSKNMTAQAQQASNVAYPAPQVSAPPPWTEQIANHKKAAALHESAAKSHRVAGKAVMQTTPNVGQAHYQQAQSHDQQAHNHWQNAQSMQDAKDCGYT